MNLFQNKRKWKEFEEIVSIIEQSLLNSPKIKVLTNAHLKDNQGIKRQVDILIEHDLSSRYKTQIIIECKYHSRSISIEKIDAFATKCNSLNVQHKVFVSNKGFQKGAILQANSHNIKLLTLKEIKDNIISNKIVEVAQAYGLPKYTIHFDPNLKDDPSSIIGNYINIPCVYCKGKNSEEVGGITIANLIDFSIRQQDLFYHLYNPLWNDYIKEGDQILNKKYRQEFMIKDGAEIYFLIENKKIGIKAINVRMDIWLYEKANREINFFQYFNLLNDEIANFGRTEPLFDSEKTENIVLNVVENKENNITRYFLSDNSNNIKELKHLATYDTITGKYTEIEN